MSYKTSDTWAKFPHFYRPGAGFVETQATSINDLGLDVTFSDFDKALRYNFEKLLKNI